MDKKWIRTGRAAVGEATTVFYDLSETDYSVESRKRLIQHTQRPGGWWYTSYFAMRGKEELKEFHSLKDAKEYVEGLYENNKD